MRAQLANTFAKLVSVALAIFLAAPCIAQSSRLQEELIGSAWVAEEIGGRAAVDRARSTLEFFTPGRVSGLAACNRYTGPVSFNGDGVAFGNFAATRMMCSEALMEQEQKFLETLAKADRLALADEGQILIGYANGAPILRFSRIIEK